MTTEPQSNNEKRQVDAVDAILAFVGELPAEDRLFVIQLSWICLAQLERIEALALPGGFADTKQRQLVALERIGQLVRYDITDPELERLLEEGDLSGLARYVGKVQREFSDDKRLSGQPT
jgi:hypothetical protein